MKTRYTLIALSALILFSFNAQGQSYYYLLDQGVDGAYNPFSGGTDVFTAPADEQFSAVQAIPFTWYFYGSPVNSYLISDNGYITFDLAAGSSDPANTSIPLAGGPNNAIYAFWDQLEISDTPSFSLQAVRSYTVGFTPDRVHVIQFEAVQQGVVANGGYLYFAIRLYEGGDFDILHQQAGPFAVGLTGTVGCENAAETLGTMVAGSPSYSYSGGAYIPANQQVIRFIYGTQPANDVALIEMNVPRVVHASDSYNLDGKIVNQGSASITTMTVEYQVDANPPVSSTLSGLSIAPNGIYSFIHPTAWTPTNPGNYSTVSLRITEVNGVPDAIPSNDTLEKSVWVNNGDTGTPHVLIEEFSTAPCGYCPDGDVVLEQVIADHPGQIMAVTHHSGYLSDAMTTSESATIASAFAAGAPTAGINRVLWPGELYVGTSRTDWDAKTALQLAEKTPVDLIVVNTWNPATREFIVNVDVNFQDFPEPGDLRLNVFLVEDSVVGTGTGYDQTNYYNSTFGHPYYNAGDPILGYVHNHVMRHAPTGAWGDNLVIPVAPVPGSHYSQSYSMILPPNEREPFCTAIAFVSYYDATANHSIVLNSLSAASVLGINHANQEGALSISVYPNPLKQTGQIHFSISKNEPVSISLLNIQGTEVKSICKSKVYFSGDHEISLDARNLSAGLYLLKIIAGNKQELMRVIIE